MATKTKNHLFAVILAGGGGTRLWPRSTKSKPKQFLKLISSETMLRETYLRIKPVVPAERILVITNKKYQKMVRDDLPEIPIANIISEPEKRDTAMAMGTAAVYAFRMDPEAVIINLAADHVVENVKEFRSTMLLAAQAALLGSYLVTVGIHPAFPHTGLGYIKVKDDFKRVDGANIFSVDSFTEKPKLARAKAFIATGKYFWNANNYVWTARSLLDAFAKHLPTMYRQLVEIEGALGTREEKEALVEAYGKVEPISIDFGISEKADNLLLVPGDFGWSDIGDWGVVYSLTKKDVVGNVTDKSRVEDPILIEVKNCFINGGKKLIAMAGMSDLIVIETKKALMIVPREKAQMVKKLVEELKARGLTDYL